MGVLRPVFRGLTGLAVAGAVAGTAIANDDNADVPVQSASAASIQPVKLTKPLYKDVTRMSEGEIAQELANVSIDKVALVVWGGDKEKLQKPVWQACEDLVKEGIPCVLVVAPDHNTIAEDAIYQVYAKSLPQGNDGHYGTNYAHQIRGDMYKAGKVAYQSNYPQQYASLEL